MKKQEFQAFTPDANWRHVLVVGAHPDDERLIGEGFIHACVKAGISVTVLLATLGEKGKIHGNRLPQKETAAIRNKEFLISAKDLGVHPQILTPRFRDSRLSDRQQALNLAVRNIVRKNRVDAIASFAIGEQTWKFAHRDHEAVAIAAVFASETADMEVYEGPKSVPPVSVRPALIGWTTNPNIGPAHQMSQIDLSARERRHRSQVLMDIYASQFSPETRHIWEPIFDRTTLDDISGNHRQLYFRTR